MQQILVILVVTAAITYLGYRFYVRLQRKSDCGPDCGCETASVVAKMKKNTP